MYLANYQSPSSPTDSADEPVFYRVDTRTGEVTIAEFGRFAGEDQWVIYPVVEIEP